MINIFHGLLLILTDGSLYGKVRTFLANLIFFVHTWMVKVMNYLDYFGYNDFGIFTCARHNCFCIKIISMSTRRQMKCKYDKSPRASFIPRILYETCQCCSLQYIKNKIKIVHPNPSYIEHPHSC
jgi:hypothetical protein